MREQVQQIFRDAVAVKQAVLEDQALAEATANLAQAMVQAFKDGRRVFLCGNGGSAADAQHIAAELSGRFEKDRPALPAEALHVNTSYLTAVANDYGYEEVFARGVQAHGREGDLLIGITTSGTSANVLRALEAARQQKMQTAALCGQTLGKLPMLSDHVLAVPSNSTPRIQEAHILLGHALCALVEKKMFG